jgi:hypothetical protein
MNESFRQTLTDYILSGHAFLHAHTPEKPRFVQELKEIAAVLPPDGRPIFVWSPATGWQDAEGKPAKTDTGAELGTAQSADCAAADPRTAGRGDLRAEGLRLLPAVADLRVFRHRTRLAQRNPRRARPHWPDRDLRRRRFRDPAGAAARRHHDRVQAA